VRQQIACAQDTLQKLKTKEMQPFLPELESAVAEAFASDQSFSKKARFHQLRDRVNTVLKKEYERLMEACMEDLERVVAATCASMYTPPITKMNRFGGQIRCPEVLVTNPGLCPQPLDTIMGYILVQVVYACLDALPNAATSPTAHPTECEATVAKRKSIQEELTRLQGAETVIQGLQ